MERELYEAVKGLLRATEADMSPSNPNPAGSDEFYVAVRLAQVAQLRYEGDHAMVELLEERIPQEKRFRQTPLSFEGVEASDPYVVPPPIANVCPKCGAVYSVDVFAKLG